MGEDPPPRRGWTPNELRRLRETDPEEYARVTSCLKNPLAEQLDGIRRLHEAIVGPARAMRSITDATRGVRDMFAAAKPPELLEFPRVKRYRDRDPDDGPAGYWHPSQDEPLAAPADETEDAPEPVPKRRARPALPNVGQLNAFSHATLTKAVEGFARDMTRGDVERRAGLPGPDARRVRLMYAEGLVRLNAQGKLAVDPRVARRRSLYVLRYLDEGGTRWLDPNVELQGR